MGARQSMGAEWWRGAVIYQIYPRSYQDTSGDGVGDLRGIIERLPHVASLGADAVWISPFFKSPMLDFGYDVSDYRAIDPLFGDMDDFGRLAEKTRELGLKLIVDLVMSHTSDRHPWFGESRASRDSGKSDWYVWADAKPDGTPPNNWLSVFGGSAWEWDARRGQYYLHNFLKEQPDLNFHCAEVQNQLLDVARFWLERGANGFRLDTINFYFHDPALRDNPALGEGEKNDRIAPGVNPYNWQNHLYDKSRPENLEFLKRLRALMDGFPETVALGEVGDAQRGLEIQSEYTSGGDKVHMCYSFEFLSGKLTGGHVARVLTDFEEKGPDGWPCWAFSNHDVIRHVSRWSGSPRAQKLYLALLVSLRGAVCLYQGEELGLSEQEISFDDLKDPYGIRFWPEFKGRDGCRTPMPWTSDPPHGGFSEAKPWLPVSEEALGKSVQRQERDPDSTLAAYRRMIAFRKESPALKTGSLEILEQRESFICFTRKDGAQEILCAFSLSEESETFSLPGGGWEICPGLPFEVERDGAEITLGGFQACFAAKGPE